MSSDETSYTPRGAREDHGLIEVRFVYWYMRTASLICMPFELPATLTPDDGGDKNSRLSNSLGD